MIDDYAQFPEDIDKKISDSPFPREAYTVTNTARDIIATVL